MQLILLAAGKGSRLPKKFRNQPKCMAKVLNKTILDHNIKFFNKFKNKIIITGYKSKKLSKFISDNNFKEIYNNKFRSTNMVHSLFLCSRYIKEDMIVCYSDIIFNSSIFNLFLEKKNIIPLNKNWLKIWKLRMSDKEILNDAEKVEIKKGYLHEIGEKISSDLPKYQFMGIFKLRKNSFFKLNYFYKKNKNKKIDMTSFLNLTIKKNIIKLKIKIYRKFWYEVDSEKDILSFPKGYFKW